MFSSIATFTKQKATNSSTDQRIDKSISNEIFDLPNGSIRRKQNASSFHTLVIKSNFIFGFPTRQPISLCFYFIPLSSFFTKRLFLLFLYSCEKKILIRLRCLIDLPVMQKPVCGNFFSLITIYKTIERFYITISPNFNVLDGSFSSFIMRPLKSLIFCNISTTSLISKRTCKQKVS